jgi:hypothetical protein
MMADLVDWAAKLLPAVAILAAIFAAKAQLKAAKRASDATTAKNYYRKMLHIFLQNADILYAGIDAESFQLLKQDNTRYRRYRMLFTNMAFACQEMYLAFDMRKEEHWAHAIRAFISLFKYHILSEKDFPPFIQAGLDPKFLEFMKKVVAQYEHPASAMKLDRQVPS